jgi:transposase-like protein
VHKIRSDIHSKIEAQTSWYGDTFYIDEVFVKINGKQHYLWRAVDQDGEVVDVYLQARRDGATAKRFFKRLLRSHGGEPRKIVTDKLRSYGVAHRELMPDGLFFCTRLSDFWLHMLLYQIYSIWVGIKSLRSITVISG